MNILMNMSDVKQVYNWRPISHSSLVFLLFLRPSSHFRPSFSHLHLRPSFSHLHLVHRRSDCLYFEKAGQHAVTWFWWLAQEAKARKRRKCFRKVTVCPPRVPVSYRINFQKFTIHRWGYTMKRGYHNEEYAFFLQYNAITQEYYITAAPMTFRVNERAVRCDRL